MDAQDRLEALRALLHPEPSAELWTALVAHIEAQGGLDALELDYVEDHLEAWPDALRVLPNAWIKRLLSGGVMPAWYRLARRLSGLQWAARDGSMRAYDHDMGLGYQLEDDMKRLAGMEIMAWLRELDLSLMPYGSRELLQSPRLREVRTLIHGDVYNDEDVEALLAKPWVQGLRHFVAGPNNGASASAWARFLGRGGPPGLQTLSLKNSKLDDTGLDALVEAGHHAALEVLRLGYSRLTSAGVMTLAQMPARLVELDLGLVRPSRGALDMLVSSPWLYRLRMLWLNACKLGPEHAEVLAESPHLAAWTHLDLGHNELDATSMRTLFSRPASLSLEALSLRNNTFGDQGARVLAASESLGKLRRLNLRECGLSAGALEAIARSPGLGTVEELDAMHNPGVGQVKDLLARRFADLTI